MDYLQVVIPDEPQGLFSRDLLTLILLWSVLFIIDPLAVLAEGCIIVFTINDPSDRRVEYHPFIVFDYNHSLLFCPGASESSASVGLGELISFFPLNCFYLMECHLRDACSGLDEEFPILSAMDYYTYTLTII